MMLDEIKNIKVEISLKDLHALKEYAEFYFNVVKERDQYMMEAIKLRKTVEELKAKVQEKSV